jgi:DNA polymerase-4
MMGKNGLELWKKANGIDNTPVEPYTERKSLSTEHTYLQDTIDIKKIESLILGMVEKLAYQARKEQWLVSTLVLKIRYTNFDTENLQRKIAYTSCDHVLSKIALELFHKLYNRRMRIRLVGVSFTGLVRGNYQISMFEDTEEMIALYQAMDKIKNRFGYDAVTRCGGRNISSKAGNIITNPKAQNRNSKNDTEDHNS